MLILLCCLAAQLAMRAVDGVLDAFLVVNPPLWYPDFELSVSTVLLISHGIAFLDVWLGAIFGVVSTVAGLLGSAQLIYFGYQVLNNMGWRRRSRAFSICSKLVLITGYVLDFAGLASSLIQSFHP